MLVACFCLLACRINCIHSSKSLVFSRSQPWLYLLSNASSLTLIRLILVYSKTCVKQPLSNIPKIVFQDLLTLTAGQKYSRMLQGEHSAILLTFIKLPFVIKILVLSIVEWPFHTGFTVFHMIYEGHLESS